jgi:hypothetical protein
MLPYSVEVVDDDAAVTAYAGLPLIVETMRKLGVSAQLDKQLGIRQRNNGTTDSQKAEGVVLRMASGGTCLSDIEKLRADKGLERLLDYRLPSEQALWNFFNAFHDDALVEEARDRLRPGDIAYIPSEKGPLRALGRVNVALAQAVATRNGITRATLDHDATVCESHKREAKAHYKDGRGYPPAVVYFVEADQVICDEFRDGNVPAGMENLRLIQHGFASLPSTIKERFFRADSACYEQKVLRWLADEEREGGPAGFIGFSISADMTKELSVRGHRGVFVDAARGPRSRDCVHRRCGVRLRHLAEARAAPALRRREVRRHAARPGGQRVRQTPGRGQQPARPDAR